MLEADIFLGACCRKTMAPKKPWILPFLPELYLLKIRELFQAGRLCVGLGALQSTCML